MTDSEMTPDQRAEALIAEAARMIDRSIRHLPHGVISNESKKLVELIVEAAVERMKIAEPVIPRCVCGRPLSDGDHEHPDWMLALKPGTAC
jgi:hypothetical protein